MFDPNKLQEIDVTGLKKILLLKQDIADLEAYIKETGKIHLNSHLSQLKTLLDSCEEK